MDHLEESKDKQQLSDQEFELKLKEMIRLGKENMEYGNNPEFRNVIDELEEDLYNFQAARTAGPMQILFQQDLPSPSADEI
ncbi:MAG: hypothetical protein K2Q22_09320 [Cytophagales bacterium]|nr:hypothetical protein [Cytophagales bacterium]